MLNDVGILESITRKDTMAEYLSDWDVQLEKVEGSGVFRMSDGMKAFRLLNAARLTKDQRVLALQSIGGDLNRYHDLY